MIFYLGLLEPFYQRLSECHLVSKRSKSEKVKLWKIWKNKNIVKCFSIIKTGRFKSITRIRWKDENSFHQTTVKKVICSLNYYLGRAVLHPFLDEKSFLITKVKVVGVAKQHDLREKSFTKLYFIKLNKQRKIR